MIDGFDDIEVVFDHENGVAFADEFLEDGEEFFDIVEMEACGGLIENIEGFAGGTAGKFGSELDSLRFTAGKSGGGLAELDVTEADFGEGLQFGGNAWNRGEEFESFIDGHCEDFEDIFAAVANGQSVFVIAFAFAGFARNINIGQEVHFDFFDPIAGTGFTTATLDIEAETTSFVATRTCFGSFGEEVANVREDASISSGVGARRAADR